MELGVGIDRTSFSNNRPKYFAAIRNINLGDPYFKINCMYLLFSSQQRLGKESCWVCLHQYHVGGGVRMFTTQLSFGSTRKQAQIDLKLR